LLLSFFILAYSLSSQILIENPLYKDILNLNYDSARLKLNNSSKSKDLAYQMYLEDKIDFIQINIDQDPLLFNELKSKKENRLERLNKSPISKDAKQWAKSEIYIHWSINSIRMGEYFLAAWELNKAKTNAEAITAESPYYTLSLKNKGLISCFSGLIPEQYQWIAHTFGYKGSIKDGLEKLSAYNAIKHDNILLELDGLISIALIESYFNNNYKKGQTILKGKNSILCQFLYLLISLKGNDHDSFETSLISLNKHANKLPYLEYLRGLSKLYKMDKSGIKHFIHFNDKFKGNSYKSDALEKASWLSLINGDTLGYVNYQQQLLNTPNESTDADLNAISTSMQNTLPNIHLLKARILFDGGKYRKALEILQDDIKIKISTKHEQAEYYYRLGRTYHLLELYEEACNNYKTAINISKDFSLFFKGSAAYHLARIYESLKEYEKAKDYFNLCLSFKAYPYKRSFDIKAKSGLQRIEQKLEN